jgi:hypothetical protein
MRIVLLATTTALALGGCASFSIMPNHGPEALLEQVPLTQPAGGGSFGKRRILIELAADLAVAPAGAYLDDINDHITPVNLSYVVPQPGMVLYEKIADALARRDAVVLRSYEPWGAPRAADAATTRVSVLLRDFELHMWRRAQPGEPGPLFLARAVVETRVRGTTTMSALRIKVPAAQDPFVALADQYVRELHGALAGGGPR